MQVENYVVEERGGFIWLFYEGPKGNRLPADERPPIPCIPELDDPNWTPVYGELEFDCGHWAVFENAIDMAHIHYLHNDSFGNDDKPVVMNMEGRLLSIHDSALYFWLEVHMSWKYAAESDCCAILGHITQDAHMCWNDGWVKDFDYSLMAMFVQEQLMHLE